MQRRKFVIGMGALASGAAAAVGTGAFSSVEADRTVSLNVASDENAYFGMEPTPDATFAQTSGGVVELNFDNTSDASGTGLNANADTGFGPELIYKNQGTKEILITMDVSEVDTALSGDGSLSFFLHSQDVGKNATLKQNSGPREGGNQGVILESGASVKVSGLFRNVSEDDIGEDIGDANITIYAVTDDSEKYPDAGPSTAGSHVPTISSDN
ncbi:hypothetical protein [Natronobacterium lacisalsi]|nr:hypothetical protein [Halobiforma lacisalsi]